MKLHSEIYSFFPVNLILRRRCGPVIYAAVLCCSLLASEASITCSHHANKFMCTRQNSPAKAGAKLKGNSSTSKMISLCDFSSWASGLGFSSAGKPSALATLWLTCEWRQWRATPVSPPTGRCGVNGGATAVFEPQFLILFLVSAILLIFLFLWANCQQTIHNLNSDEFCWVKTSPVSKQPLALPAL